jgi:hypothetical protein
MRNVQAMSDKTEFLSIEKPHFTVSLYANLLKIDLKGTTKNVIVEALENKPILRETIGEILGMFVPLHIHLSDIHSVEMDESGKVNLNLPRHRNITIRLERKEAKELAEKLNQLIPRARERELKRLMEEHRLQRIEGAARELVKEETIYPIGGTQYPIPEPPGVREAEKEATEETAEREEN